MGARLMPIESRLHRELSSAAMPLLANLPIGRLVS